MKKLLCLLFALLMLMNMTACGGGDASAPEEDETETTETDTRPVDVDLTLLTGNLVYSEVFHMMTEPEDYVGKTVKMVGLFDVMYAIGEDGEPDTENVSFACFIADAAACCQQGMEFVLAGEHSYPDDYPSKKAVITVVGEFETYYVGEDRYCRLANAEFV